MDAIKKKIRYDSLEDIRRVALLVSNADATLNVHSSITDYTPDTAPCVLITPKQQRIKIAKPLLEKYFTNGTPDERRAVVLYATIRYHFRHGSISGYIQKKAIRELQMPRDYFRKAVSTALRIGLVSINHGDLKAATNRELEHRFATGKRKYLHYYKHFEDNLSHKDIVDILQMFSVKRAMEPQAYVVSELKKLVLRHDTPEGIKALKAAQKRNDTIGKSSTAPLLVNVIGLRKLSTKIGCSLASTQNLLSRMNKRKWIETKTVSFIAAKGFDASDYAPGYCYFNQILNATITILGTELSFERNNFLKEKPKMVTPWRSNYRSNEFSENFSQSSTIYSDNLYI